MEVAANPEEILHDFSPLLKVYKNGKVERFTGTEFVPPCVDPQTGVQSKDVQISQETNLSARLYLPAKADPTKKLPLLVYYHGGAFLIESAFSPLYQKHLNLLVAEANVVAVSVNYRLAPEHPLPIAFKDSWEALKWVSQSEEDWIKEYADKDRVFLGGDSAGANIAHSMAMRLGAEELDGINVRGIFLNCPYFSGKDPIGNEATDRNVIGAKSSSDKIWLFACPTASGCDEPWINPAMEKKLSSLGCKKVLVYVAEKDFLKERGWYYKETLSKCGWNGEIEYVEVEGEQHVFSVLFPDTGNAIAMIKKVASFINQ